MDKYSYISNAHGAYIDELYKSYKENPDSVDHSWQKFFEGFEFSLVNSGKNGSSISVEKKIDAPSDKEIQVRNLIYAYRSRGHLRAKTNPVRERKDRKALLDLSDFGLSDADLDTVFEASKELGIGALTLRKLIENLQYIYTGTVGFEFMYIREPEILKWFRDKSEKEAMAFNPSIEEKKRILKN